MIRTYGEYAMVIGVFSIISAMFGAQPSVISGLVTLMVGVVFMIFGTPPPSQEGKDG